MPTVQRASVAQGTKSKEICICGGPEMIKNKTAALLLTSIGVLGLSQVAIAEDCSGDIGAVRTAVDFGFCLDNLDNHRNGEKTCERLGEKLDNAETKIWQGKFDDATKKLNNFQTALDNLLSKPLISGPEYNDVNGLLLTAKTCVAGL
jgi:hypothetical protein